MTTKSSHSDKIARLQAAIENWQGNPEQPLIDREAEKAQAPVKAKAMRLINHRPRSEAELRKRLADSDFPPELVEAVVGQCLTSGLVDDRAFAHEWVRQRATRLKKSPAVLKQELRSKGITEQIIEDALQQVTPEDQVSMIATLVGKKAQSVSKVPRDRAEYDACLRRIVGVAARRGFPQGASLSAAREALDARIEELTSDISSGASVD